VVDAPAPTVNAPTALALADVPNDNGYWVSIAFTPSTSATVRSYQFYWKDAANMFNLYAEASKGVVQSNGKLYYLVPVPKIGAITLGVAASTSDVVSGIVSGSGTVMKAADVMVADIVEGAAKIAVADVSVIASGDVTVVDDIAPSPLTAFVMADNPGAGAGILVSWTAPADHGVVGSVANMPIYGVEKYEVWRRTGTADFALVGTSGGLALSYIDTTVPDGATIYQYMIKYVDGNVEHMLETGIRSAFAKGAIASDFNTNGVVDFADFSIFAANYGKTMAANPETFLSGLDLKVDNSIDFADFSIFAASYGSTAKAAKVVAGMPTTNIPFGLGAQVDEATSTYYVTVSVGKDDALKGFEFFLAYNDVAVEFVDGSVNGLVGLTMTDKVGDGMIRVATEFIGEQFDGSVIMAFRSRGVNASIDFEIVSAWIDGAQGLAAATNLAQYTYRALPTVYALSPNYPNPFNPTTTINYSIPESGNVELAIFNAAGQKVRTLINEHQSASFYKVVWDGRNDTGESVASGIYFYRLVSGNFAKIQKMTLVK